MYIQNIIDVILSFLTRNMDNIALRNKKWNRFRLHFVLYSRYLGIGSHTLVISHIAFSSDININKNEDDGKTIFHSFLATKYSTCFVLEETIGYVNSGFDTLKNIVNNNNNATMRKCFCKEFWSIDKTAFEINNCFTWLKCS